MRRSSFDRAGLLPAYCLLAAGFMCVLFTLVTLLQVAQFALRYTCTCEEHVLHVMRVSQAEVHRWRLGE